MNLRNLQILGALVVAAGAGAQTIPDFSLQDVNPTSLRSQDRVSPRDYLLQVSGFYFGTAG